MADINEIDLDVEEVRSNVSGIALSITDSEGNYSEEWLTTDCISKAFNSINTTLTDFESAKGVLLNHLEELDAISAEADSKAEMLADFVSKFPSRSGNAKAHVSDGVTSLNVRKGPGMDNSVIGYLTKGTIVSVVGKDANTGWTEVLFDDGTRGYVSTKYITIDPSIPEATGDETTTDSSQGDGKVGKGLVAAAVTAFVNTQNSNLNLRENPGIDQPIKGHAIKGSTIKVLEEDKGNGWTKVELEDGTTGYVSTKYIRINKAIPTPDTAGVNDASQQTAVTTYVNTQSSRLNVRIGKGTDTAIKTSVDKGTALTVLEKDDGSGWTKVKLSDGTIGYVATKWLSDIRNGDN